MPSPPPRPKAPPIHWDLLSDAPGPTKKKIKSIVGEDRDPTRVFSTKYFAGRSKRGGRGPQNGRSL